jgi:hypothetical protein
VTKVVTSSPGFLGTVFLTCLMETGPLAGVGFALMAGTLTRFREEGKRNFGFCRATRERLPGRAVFEKGNGFCHPRGWDINSAADPTWAKCLRFWYRVTSEARLPAWQ